LFLLELCRHAPLGRCIGLTTTAQQGVK
jgi:hypothetical protein